MDPFGLAPDSVAVARLRLKARPGDEGEVRHALDSAPWPTVEDGAWVLVRRLALRSSAGSLGQGAARLVGECAVGAVLGSAPGSESAQAVRFPDLESLIAALCADLVAGRAPRLWYWRTWSRLFRLPLAEALAEPLSAHPLRLASVAARLSQIGALARVWRALGPAGATPLWTCLATALGPSLALHSAFGSDPGPAPAPGGRVRPGLPSAVRARWSGALAGLSPQDPRARLAALLTLLEWRPQDLGPGVESSLAELALDLVGLGPGPAPEGQARPSETWIPGSEATPPSIEARAGGQARRPDPRQGAGPGPGPASLSELGQVEPGLTPSASAEPDDEPGLPGRDLSRPSVGRLGEPPPGSAAPQSWARSLGASPAAPRRGAPGVHGRTGPGPLPGGSPPRSGSVPPSPVGRSAVPWSQGPEDSAEGLLTQEGGLFYLINFLARPEAQALLGCDPGALDSGGWAWLAALGLSLGMAPEGPLAGFLAERLGMAPHLGIADLALPDCTAALLNLGARLYGKSEVWVPGLLRVQAEVRLSPSHLDCHYPLACVRLAVRRVALDVNPGWVPWLGRVVTFHYDAPGRPLFRP